MDDLLSLKWNNHQTTFINAFGVLRDKQLYTDITLACDGKFYGVHKIILSTCSDYFSAILDQTNCKSPVIILKDIRHEDLEYLLDYMYLGEVNVPQSSLSTLLKAAECLQLKGLAAPDDDVQSVEKTCNKQSSLFDNHNDDSHLHDIGDDLQSNDGHHNYSNECRRSYERPIVRTSDGRRSYDGHYRSCTNNDGRRSYDGYRRRDSDGDSFPSPKRTRQEEEFSISTNQEKSEHSRSSPTPSSQPSMYLSNLLSSSKFSSPVDGTSSISSKLPPSTEEEGRGSSAESDVKIEYNDSIEGEVRVDDSYHAPTEEMFKHESNTSFDGHSDQGDNEIDVARGDGLDRGLPGLLHHAADSLQSANYKRPSLSDINAFSQNDSSGWPPDGSPMGLPLSFSSLEGSSHQTSTGVRLRQLLSISSSLPSLNNSISSHDSKKISSNSLGSVSCSVCHKLFTGPNRRQVLRRHLIIHTGERPYPCHLCQYRANQKSNLNVHIVTYHGREHLKSRCS